jgi:hypothetical protein
MMTRTTWQDLLNVSQALREIYVLEFKDPEIEISKLYNVESSTSAEEKDLTTYEIGNMENVGEGGETPYDDPGEGYPTVYAPATYKKGVKITEELLEDNKYREAVKAMKYIARTANRTPLEYACKYFNYAFTANPEGYANYNSGALALCSSAHTSENGDGTTQSNADTKPLTLDNFDLALTALVTQKTGNGKLLSFTGKPKLIVGPSNRAAAIKITESELEPDTANNAINVFKGAVADVIVNPFMHTSGGATYNTYWFLMSPDAKFNFFWRKKPVYEEEQDFDNDVIKTKVKARWVAGASDWRGFWGSTGQG